MTLGTDKAGPVISEDQRRQLEAALDQWVIAKYANDIEGLAHSEDALDLAFRSIGFKTDQTPAHAAGLAAMTKFAARMASALNVLHGIIND